MSPFFVGRSPLSLIPSPSSCYSSDVGQTAPDPREGPSPSEGRQSIYRTSSRSEGADTGRIGKGSIMAITTLPPGANLENLRKQAKTLLRRVKADDRNALERVGPYFGDPRVLTLQQAQLVIARGYGFSSWTQLKTHLESADPTLETDEQRANRFLDLACVSYSPVPDVGPKRFSSAAELLAGHPSIRTHSIHCAAAAGDADGLRRWLDHDPTLVDARGEPFGWEPLLYAAYARLPGATSLAAGLLLLDRGANPNAFYMWSGECRFTALTGVIGHGELGPVNQPEHPDMAEFARALLSRGADPNDGQACYNRQFTSGDDWLRLLLEFGLEPEDRNNWLVRKNGELVPVDTGTMETLLTSAVRHGHSERARLLLEHGAPISDGAALYRSAVRLGHTALAQSLVDAGAPSDGLTLEDRLTSEIMSGQLTEAERLIDANPAAFEALNHTRLLRTATGQRNLAAIETMIVLGFDLNPEGQTTALHDAAFEGDLQIIDALLSAGASPLLRDPDHQATPREFAEFAGQTTAALRIAEAEAGHET